MDVTMHRVAVAGWSLAVSEYPAHGPARGVVVAGHAMMCNRRTLDRPRGQGLASTLAAAGLHVYTFDVRGHGDSGRGAADGGRWHYDEVVEEDIPAVVTWARARHPGLRLGLLGHSLVGHAGLLWVASAGDAPVDALVLYGANLWLRRYEPSRWRWLRKWVALQLWRLISRWFGYFPARRLGAGSDDEPLTLVEDFALWARTDECRRRADGFDYLDGLDQVAQPVLAVVGTRDRLLCAPDCAARFMAAVPNHVLERVPGAGHMSLVTDAASRPMWQQTAAWLLDQLADPTG